MLVGIPLSLSFAGPGYTSRQSAGTPTSTCETAVVGGGWAGVYAAWRLVVDTKKVQASSLCLFEARGVVGGRSYSVAVGDLVIDVGAYRFSAHQHLPGDLILKRLHLSAACYEPDCAPDKEFNQTLYKVVDARGENSGYDTPIRTMLAELVALGTGVFYDHELTGVYEAADQQLSLHFAGGAVVGASAVLLNLPRAAIQRLDPTSALFPASSSDLSWQMLRNCTPCSDGKTPVGERLGVKVYAVYDDPWWISKLNLTDGNFKAVDGSAPPLVGRYHDGPVRHTAAGEAGTASVIGPGALEAVYTYSFTTPQVEWYLPFAPLRADDPLVVTTDPALLEPLHARLMSFHAAAFAAKGLNASAVPGIDRVVMGVWTSDALARLPNPMSSNFRAMPVAAIADTCPAEPCLAGVSPQAYTAAVEAPNAHANIHIANNDYTWTMEQDVPCCWAEQSLRAVEKTLHDKWGVAAPAWLDAAYYAQLLQA